MAQNEKLFSGQGGYVFVSHSHNDIEKVRKVRNYLEEKGYEPILFFLKCMGDSNQKDLELLNTLIEREISSREFFLYLDSENARNSEWVQKEVNYANSFADKYLKKINIDVAECDFETKVFPGLDSLMKDINIYLTGGAKFKAEMLALQEAFRERDYRVFTFRDITVGRFYGDVIQEKMQEAASNGYVVVLLEQGLFKENVVAKYEIPMALSMGARIIPILVEDLDLQELIKIFPVFGTQKIYRLLGKDTAEVVREIIRDLRSQLFRWY